jgi:hypothetical protein
MYTKFNLVVHGTQPFVLNQRPSSYELVGNAFHAVAVRANNRKDFGDGVSILTFNDHGLINIFLFIWYFYFYLEVLVLFVKINLIEQFVLLLIFKDPLMFFLLEKLFIWLI